MAQFGILVTIFVESRPAAQIAQFGVLVTIFVEFNYFPWTPQSPTPFPIMELDACLQRDFVDILP